MKKRNRKRGWCPVCRHLIRLTKDGKLYRHGYSFLQRGIGRSRVRVDTRKACEGTGQLGEELGKPFEWTQERRELKCRLKDTHVSDQEVSELVELGYSEDDILQVMVILGHTIGRDKNGNNEWWPADRVAGQVS